MYNAIVPFCPVCSHFKKNFFLLTAAKHRNISQLFRKMEWHFSREIDELTYLILISEKFGNQQHPSDVDEATLRGGRHKCIQIKVGVLVRDSWGYHMHVQSPVSPNSGSRI